MPNHPSPEPLRRVDLNLYESDVAWLRSTIGTGWSGFVRELVRNHIKAHPRAKPATVGDLAHD